MRDDALTARIAATKQRLFLGGLLQEIEWGVPIIPIGPPDIRGRKTYEYSEIDALIEQRPALDRGQLVTDRNDNTVVTILDQVAITDEHLFRWGDPPHTYKVKAIDGVVQDEENGTKIFQRNYLNPLGQRRNPSPIAWVEYRQVPDVGVPSRRCGLRPPQCRACPVCRCHPCGCRCRNLGIGQGARLLNQHVHARGV